LFDAWVEKNIDLVPEPGAGQVTLLDGQPVTSATST